MENSTLIESTTTKVSHDPSNDFCPQTLFLYGTMTEEGTPNFGLFCWFSYFWDNGLCVMACIGGPKLTLDRIHETKVFTANLVTESILPLADYFGTAEGYVPGKMDIQYKWEISPVLKVPVLSESPVVLELEAEDFIPRDGGEIMLCRIRNVLRDKELDDESVSIEEKLRKIAPVNTTCMTYFSRDGHELGAWHEPARNIKDRQ